MITVYCRKLDDDRGWWPVEVDEESHAPEACVKRYIRSVVGGITFVQTSLDQHRVTLWRVEQMDPAAMCMKAGSLYFTVAVTEDEARKELSEP
jgi:hypothetical protein